MNVFVFLHFIHNYRSVIPTVKYLGLLAMSKILKTHPKSVQAHKDLILACLDDKDESIRLRALDLLYGMVSKKNLMEIVRRLLGHMERAEGSAYRDELLFKVIEICSQGSYQYVTNFEWYLTVLVELIQLETGSKHGGVIATQLLDVAIRVQAVRAFAVAEMTALLETFPVAAMANSSGGSGGNGSGGFASGGATSSASASASSSSFAVSGTSSTMYEVLYAAAWIVGEFASELADPERSLGVLLQTNRQLPGHIQAVYVQNVVKLFARICTERLERRDAQSIVQLCDMVLDKLPLSLSSGHIEVQERASSAFVLVQMLRDELSGDNADGNDRPVVVQTTDDILMGIETNDACGGSDEVTTASRMARDISLGAIEIVHEMALLFAGDLNPVAPKAQRKVQLPDGLDLDAWINPPSPEESSDESDGDNAVDRICMPGGNEHLFVSAVGGFGGGSGSNGAGAAGGGGRHQQRQPDLTEDEMQRMRQARQLEQSFNPNYLKSNGASAARRRSPTQPMDDGCEDIPIAELAIDVPLNVSCEYQIWNDE